jgi:hypothetical protein
MKNALIALACLLALPAFAGKETGGGIILAAEFATTGRQAIKILSDGDPSLTYASILALIKDTKVIPVDNICYTDPVLQKQYCEDAHYDAAGNVVLFSHEKWDGFTCKEKLLLATHEFLRAAGLEGEDYTYSGRFLTLRLARCSSLHGSEKQQTACADLTIRLENAFGSICESLQELNRSRSLIRK